MSKIAASVGGNDRAALEAFVAQGDTSVPGVEASDINDGDILARTRENVNPNGLFQFVYIPDDGSEQIVSDWVDQEHKKKLTRGWVDGVKAALIGRAQSKIQEAQEKAFEERAKRLRAEQLDEPVAEAVPMVVKPSRVKVVTEASSLSGSDPAQYVEEQLEIARERLRAAEQAQQDIVREVLTARRDYEKWKTLFAALDTVDDGGLRGENADTDSPQLPGIGGVQSGVRVVQPVVSKVHHNGGGLGAVPARSQRVQQAVRAAGQTGT